MVFDEEQLEALLERVLVDVELHLHPGRRDGEVDGDRKTGGDKEGASEKLQGDAAGEVAGAFSSVKSRGKRQEVEGWERVEGGGRKRGGEVERAIMTLFKSMEIRQRVRLNEGLMGFSFFWGEEMVFLLVPLPMDPDSCSQSRYLR